MNALVLAVLLDTVDPVESENAKRDAKKLAGSQGNSSDQSDEQRSPEKILAQFDSLINELKRDKARERRARQTKVRQARNGNKVGQTKVDQRAQVEPRADPTQRTLADTSSTVSPRPKPAETGLTGRKIVLRVEGVVKHFGDTVAVDGIDLAVEQGTIFGVVGPNGAGKTTTLSMITGLLRPDAGTVTVHGANVWENPAVAKRQMGVLPDRLRLFDRLTGRQLLYYSGVLRGLPADTVRERIAELAVSFGLEDALGRLVSDYSAGMTKKLSLAAALIHSPRLLVLDEPFESVDPVSATNVTAILQRYVEAGGTVVLSSHSMDLIQRVCDVVAIIDSGKVLASGSVDEVRGKGSLQEKFVELVGGRTSVEGMEWLHSFSD
ncbi:MAG: ATP-binding cassette domain-containing protein [Terrimesophilobacter sp.]